INNEPYTFTHENAQEFLTAARAAYPSGIPDRKSFFELGMACAELVVVHGWPEREVRKILDEICSEPKDANTDNNDAEWQNYLSGTRGKVKQGERVLSHRSVFAKARENGWQPMIEAAPNWLESMNNRFFVAPYSTTVAVFRISADTSTPLKSDAFKLLLANKSVEVATPNGTKKAPIADAWLKHTSRREYSGVGFWPSAQAPVGYFNFWQGWPVQPVYGDVSPALEHINQVICNEDKNLFNYIIGWLAYCVQHPNEPGYVALVIMGGRGTGKSMFAEWIKLMFGRYAMSVAKGELLTGQFTGHLEKMVLMVAEEAFWAGDKAAENALKHVITGTTLSIHPKGFTPYDAPNYLHVIMTSNEEWVVPAGVDERRFAVCTVSESRKGDVAYFKSLANWASDGGIAALLDYLLKYDLQGFNVRTPPDSKGLRSQKIMSLDPAARWIMSRLEIGALVGDEWKQETSASSMVSNFCDHQHLNAYERRRAETQLGNTVRKIFPEVKKVRLRSSGVRGYVYRLGVDSLQEARTMFEKYVGMDGLDWGDDE
ncbi:MAG: primase-helicase family protein, partial [Betaproteobacteria bacterium]